MNRLIAPLFQRGTIQSPSVPLSAAYDILTAGEKSKTGIDVTETKALGLPAFWKGVNLITRALGKTPLNVKQRIGETKIIDRTHPAWYLLRKLPSGIYSDVPITPFVFKQTLQLGALMSGNGFAYIARDNQANPISLIWLDPNTVTPIKENGRLIYLVYMADGQLVRVNPNNMIHIKGLSFDGITGYSVIDVLKDSLGLNLAYQINQSVFFRNGMKPGWIIEVPWRFKDHSAVTEFRNRLGKVHQGVERSHIPAILENGAKATALNVTHEESQMLQSREFDLRMLANIFCLPSSKLNDVAKVAYNSLEQENQSVLDDAYEPLFVIWEEELEYKLLTEEQKRSDSHTIRFERRRLVQTPFKDRIEGYNKALLSGWLNRDEVRDLEDINPMPNGEGQKFFVPVNVTETGEDNNNGNTDNEMNINDERIRKAREITLSQIQIAAERLFDRRIAKASKRNAINPSKFMRWLLDDLFDNNRTSFIELLEPKIQLLRLLDNQSTETRTSVLVDDYLLSIKTELNQLAGMVRGEELLQHVDSFMIKHESKVKDFVDCLIKKG